MASKTTKIHRFNKAAAQAQYEATLNDFYSRQYSNQVKKNLVDEQAKDTYKQNMRIRDQRENAKLEAYEKSENSFVEQLVFNEQAAKIAREGEERVFNERILAAAFKSDELNIGFDKQVIDSKFQYDQQELNIANAITDFKTDKALVNLQLSKTKSDTRFALEQNEQKLANTRAAAGTEEYQNRIRKLQQTGQVRAQGRQGVSAQRALQSITALSGVNTALLADQLTRSELSINTEREILKATYNKDTNKGFAVREAKLSKRKAKDRKKQTITSAENNKKFVADTLGISQEQFNMSREQLGNSLLSAADSYELRLKKINRDKYAKDLQTYAQRQLKPRVSPELPKPFESELPISVKPPRPIKPAHGMGGSTQPQAPSSGVGSLISTIATSGAAIGVAAGVLGPLAPPIAAAVGGLAMIGEGLGIF